MSNKKEPLKESIDYPDFVGSFVKKRLAKLDLETTAELAAFLAEDIEDYLLEAGKTVDQLTDAEMIHIDDLIKDRIAAAPAKGA